MCDHAHRIGIAYSPVFNHYEITYGDTEVDVHCGPWLEARLRRGVTRTIRRHDDGTTKHNARQSFIQTLLAEYNRIAHDTRV